MGPDGELPVEGAGSSGEGSGTTGDLDPDALPTDSSGGDDACSDAPIPVCEPPEPTVPTAFVDVEPQPADGLQPDRECTVLGVRAEADEDELVGDEWVRLECEGEAITLAIHTEPYVSLDVDAGQVARLRTHYGSSSEGVSYRDLALSDGLGNLLVGQLEQDTPVGASADEREEWYLPLTFSTWSDVFCEMETSDSACPAFEERLVVRAEHDHGQTKFWVDGRLETLNDHEVFVNAARSVAPLTDGCGDKTTRHSIVMLAH